MTILVNSLAIRKDKNRNIRDLRFFHYGTTPKWAFTVFAYDPIINTPANPIILPKDI